MVEDKNVRVKSAILGGTAESAEGGCWLILRDCPSTGSGRACFDWTGFQVTAGTPSLYLSPGGGEIVGTCIFSRVGERLWVAEWRLLKPIGCDEAVFLLTGLSGFRPRIGVRRRLYAGMTSGFIVSQPIHGEIGITLLHGPGAGRKAAQGERGLRRSVSRGRGRIWGA